MYNKYMDKKHMEEVLQKTSYKTEEALLRRLASVRLVPLGISIV